MGPVLHARLKITRRRAKLIAMKFWMVILSLIMLSLGFAAGYGFAMVRVFGATQFLMQLIVRDMPEVRVRAIAWKYAWQFHYPGPDGVWGKTSQADMSTENPLGLSATDPAGADDYASTELVLPCDTKIELRVDSYDILHTLGELHEGLELDGIPGVKTKGTLDSPADPKTGRLRCELCALGPHQHEAPFRFVTKEAFETWQVEREVEAVVFRGKR